LSFASTQASRTEGAPTAGFGVTYWLGGCGNFFFGSAIEGETLPTLALEDGASRAPFFLGAHKDQLLSASVADKDVLLRRTLHVGLLSSPCGLRLYLDRAAWLRADANFT
jgi:hypothetical protein